MPKVNFRTSLLAVAVIVALLAGTGSQGQTGSAPRTKMATGPEVSAAAAALLSMLNTAPEARLKNAPGMTAEILSKLMAFRARGGKLRNLVEFTAVTGAHPTELEALLKPFQETQAARDIASERKEVPEPPGRAKAGRLQKNPNAAANDPNAGAGSQAGPIGAVRPGFYTKLPGFDDLDKIDPLKRTEFLETVNREMCSCGCQGETVAYCLVNDPGCPVVKARAKKIYDDIMTKPPR